MSLNMDAAIKLTANVSGVSGINQAKTALQQLAGGSELTNRQLVGLEIVTKKFAAANSNSIAGIRNSISALRSLREQHEINGKNFQRLTKDIEAYEKRLRSATAATTTSANATPLAGLSGSIAGSVATGGGLQAGVGAAGGALAAAGGPGGIAAAAALTAGAADYDFRDIAISGGAAPISGTRFGDAKGNSGITFPAAKTVYWMLTGGGNWGATGTGAWAASSGGVLG